MLVRIGKEYISKKGYVPRYRVVITNIDYYWAPDYEIHYRLVGPYYASERSYIKYLSDFKQEYIIALPNCPCDCTVTS